MSQPEAIASTRDKVRIMKAYRTPDQRDTCPVAGQYTVSPPPVLSPEQQMLALLGTHRASSVAQSSGGSLSADAGGQSGVGLAPTPQEPSRLGGSQLADVEMQAGENSEGRPPEASSVPPPSWVANYIPTQHSAAISGVNNPADMSEIGLYTLSAQHARTKFSRAEDAGPISGTHPVPLAPVDTHVVMASCGMQLIVKGMQAHAARVGLNDEELNRRSPLQPLDPRKHFLSSCRPKWMGRSSDNTA